MEAVFDFVRAALPWIMMGLLLATYFARSAGKKKKEEQCDDYGTEGMCLGMCFGTALGAAFGNSIAIGLPLGMLFGLAIGTGIKKERKNNEKKE